jgi:hypothetical protein
MGLVDLAVELGLLPDLFVTVTNILAKTVMGFARS